MLFAFDIPFTSFFSPAGFTMSCGIDRGATDQRIWPRSHAGNDPMPDKMNLYYSKLLYCEFQKYEKYVPMSRWACVSAWRRKVAC